MYTSKVENEIFSKVKALNGKQKTIVLEYLEKIPHVNHSRKRYRRKAMKQIRQALDAM